MTVSAGPRLNAAKSLVDRFANAGAAVAGGTPQTRAQGENARQRSPVGWPIGRDALVAELRRRLAGPETPQQRGTSYCGPAAFLYCLLEDRPDTYVAYAISIWQRGEFDFRSSADHIDIQTTPALRSSLAEAQAAEPKRRFISQLDWMTMAPLSASTRPLIGRIFGTPKPDDQAGSVSYPDVVKSWFAAVGSTLIANTMGQGIFKSPPSATIQLLKHWPNCWIVLQIDSSLLSGGGTNTFSNRHWVVVDPHHRPLVRAGRNGQVVPLSQALAFAPAGPEPAHMDEWEVSLQFVSWGKEGNPLHDPHLGSLAGRIYGGFAFSRFR